MTLVRKINYYQPISYNLFTHNRFIQDLFMDLYSVNRNQLSSTLIAVFKDQLLSFEGNGPIGKQLTI